MQIYTFTIRSNTIKITLILLAVLLAQAEKPYYIKNSFNGGEFAVPLEVREDLEKYRSGVSVMENIITLPQGPVQKRPGTKYVAQIPGEITIGYEDSLASYEMTYISENGVIWGIPVSDTTLLTLDVAAVRDVNATVVAIPMTGHPFKTGRVVKISGTTNYDGDSTLQAGTTDSNELFITKAFNAETFDGTETVVEFITVSGGAGRMVQDSSGIMYYGFNNGVGKILTNGTKDENFLSPTGGWTGGKSNLGLALTSDEAYLYVYVGDEYLLYKFDLSDGSEVWQVTTSTGQGASDIAVDSSDNVYIAHSGDVLETTTRGNCAKFAAADGTRTLLTDMGEGKESWVIDSLGYVTHVDNDMGIVIVAGSQVCSTVYDESVLYNLAVRTFDDSSGAQVALGGTYTTVLDYTYLIVSDCVVTHNNYIYVLNGIGLDHKIYKLDSDLNTITSIDAPTYACGLYVDLWQNIVVVAQDWSVSPQNDVLWFYDLDLNYITNAGGFYNAMLKTWDATVGGAHQQGNAAFYPGLAVKDYGGADDVFEVDANETVRLLPFEYSVEDSYVIGIGNGFMGFYTSE